ncbi:flagellar hook-associated protein FlgK [Vogesella sp. LIG4]|uniref:flagellar hook-associated protein FlgK n=1 Tax=Vogesella sp. LIG4 TaxID=1192162 RepID=UPI00081FF184|nr:flagellar hook-associated protein FlgK [Vogesella sp. LIG4]SCK17655.1 flagellar hook-associated protein 1 FlgK [Vogesella sp. LIG4]
MSMINIALSGAVAAQAALNASSQNIANVMTPGYTRQGVLLAAQAPLQGGVAAAGSGVNVSALLRFSDSYKSQQLWSANSQLGTRDTVQPYLSQLEQVMGSSTASINVGLDGFFKALNAASVDPSSSPLRQQVLTSAGALAQNFNTMAQVLANQRISVDAQRSSMVTQINAYSTAIAKYNQEISLAQANGDNASGLIDQRDQSIDQLAKLVGVQVVNQADGARNVSLLNGQPLVAGNTAGVMAVQSSPSGAQVLTLQFAKENFVLPDSQLGGAMGGLGSLEQQTLLPMLQSLSDMASGLATAVNNQLAAGFTPAGNPGQPLFLPAVPGSSNLLSVDTSLQAQDLAFAGSATTPGDSSNLLQIIGLRGSTMTVSGLGPVTLGDAYTQLMGNLGTQSQQNQTALTTAQTVRNQTEENWKSTSGVSQDEEATNLVQFQQMYQANMKVIAVANQLFDSTLAMMG